MPNKLIKKEKTKEVFFMIRCLKQYSWDLMKIEPTYFVNF